MEQQGIKNARTAGMAAACTATAAAHTAVTASVPARSALAAMNLLRLSTDARPGSFTL